jgi:hypothetical protein
VDQLDYSCLMMSVVYTRQTIGPLLFDPIYMFAPPSSFTFIFFFLSINVLSCLFDTSCAQNTLLYTHQTPHCTSHTTRILIPHSYHTTRHPSHTRTAPNTTLHPTALTLSLHPSSFNRVQCMQRIPQLCTIRY